MLTMWIDLGEYLYNTFSSGPFENQTFPNKTFFYYRNTGQVGYKDRSCISMGRHLINVGGEGGGVKLIILALSFLKFRCTQFGTLGPRLPALFCYVSLVLTFIYSRIIRRTWHQFKIGDLHKICIGGIE